MFSGKKLEISPVRDAYEQNGECPLCLLMTKAEKGYVKSFLGGAVMVPEARVEMNRTGFCPDHYRKLFHGGNKLGLALMVNTHLKEHIPALSASRKKLLQQARRSSAGGLFSGGKDRLKQEVDDFLSSLDSYVESCLICDRLENTLDRYLFTVVYLWQKEEEFSGKLKHSRGFCLPHLGAVVKTAFSMLPPESFSRFISDVFPLQEESLTRLTEELEVFAEHFDYLKTEQKWGSEKDALPRTLGKISGEDPQN